MVLPACLLLLFLTVSVPFFCGCSEMPERRHPLYVKAIRYKDQKNFTEAAKLFEQYLLINPKSFLAHQELASIYFDNLDLPFKAIYHYQQCLKYLPQGVKADPYRAWLKESENRYFEKLRNQYDDPIRDKYDNISQQLYQVQEENRKLRAGLIYLARKNKRLSRQIKKMQVTATADKLKPVSAIKNIVSGNDSNIKPESPDSLTIMTGKNGKSVKAAPPEFYIVKKGDTLTKISRKVYGSSKYYNYIYEANRNSLTSSSKLNIGRRLIIPALPKKRNGN